MWRGVGASDEEMAAAKHVVGFLGGSVSQVAEGKEPGTFPLVCDDYFEYYAGSSPVSSLTKCRVTQFKSIYI